MKENTALVVASRDLPWSQRLELCAGCEEVMVPYGSYCAGCRRIHDELEVRRASYRRRQVFSQIVRENVGVAPYEMTTYAPRTDWTDTIGVAPGITIVLILSCAAIVTFLFGAYFIALAGFWVAQ